MPKTAPKAAEKPSAKSAAKPIAGKAVAKGDHLSLVDGSSYIFRAYHALPPLNRKSDGLQVNAVLGFCNMLWKLLRDMPADKQMGIIPETLLTRSAAIPSAPPRRSTTSRACSTDSFDDVRYGIRTHSSFDGSMAWATRKATSAVAIPPACAWDLFNCVNCWSARAAPCLSPNCSRTRAIW